MPAGIITKEQMFKLLPFKDEIAQLKVKGSVIKEALENGVSKYPCQDGRFVAVSGL